MSRKEDMDYRDKIRKEYDESQLKALLKFVRRFSICFAIAFLAWLYFNK